MRKSASDVSTYTILVNAINAYCDRVGVERPKYDNARARLLGVDPVTISKFRNGAMPISGKLARSISGMLCDDAASRDALESQLLQHIVTAPDGSLCPPELAFVRKFGVKDSVLMVEMMDLWPFSYGFETPKSPMSLAFKDGMDAGMNVILFVQNRMRPRNGKPEQSMGDGYHETAAKEVLAVLQRMNSERVALYHLVENLCPTPRIGIRLTGFLPREAPETRWWISNRPNVWHFIPTNRGPEEFLEFFLGHGAIRNGAPVPTQEELDYTWSGWAHDRGVPGRPCPIQRWTE